jgi:hypothetical protein
MPLKAGDEWSSGSEAIKAGLQSGRETDILK